MKMSDVFNLPVKPSQLEVYGANSNEGISFDEIENAAAHAINNHDRLTEENAKLREVVRKNSQVFKLLSRDGNEASGAVTDKLQAFDSHLVNEAVLDKYK